MSVQQQIKSGLKDKSQRTRSPLWLLALGCSLLIAVSAHHWLARALAHEPVAREATSSAVFLTSAVTQNSSSNRAPHRNLSMQPEALKFSRRVGKRFNKHVDMESVINGSLIVNNDKRRQARILRRQADDGEHIEITLTGGGAGQSSFAWDAAHSLQASAESSSAEERLLVERLIYDSPDYFVMAQLGAASYFTIARQVRLAEPGSSGNKRGGDDYAGPLWDIVRVSEPAIAGVDNNSNAQSQSLTRRQRLFYINSQTGLIDRIVSEEGGQKITAEIVQWSEEDGEVVPSRIVWRRDGATLMEFNRQ